jgi:drug/metabolite transporter (DMT)-like permease
MWFFYALLGPAIWALLNHIDKYLLGRYFKDDGAGPVLVVFTGFAGIIIASAIVFFDPKVLVLPAKQAVIAMTAGALLVASYIPYMCALQRDDASTVGALYRLAPFFIVVLSYVALGEVLRPNQILGGLFTIAGSIVLTLELGQGKRGLHLRTLILMAAACFMSACTSVAFKVVALGTSFWSSAFWEYVGGGVFTAVLLGAVAPYRRAFLMLYRSRHACLVSRITIVGELLNLFAQLAVGFAGLTAPLALVSIVTGLHPFFLLVYGILLTLFAPKLGRERLSVRGLTRKVIAVAVMYGGVVIALG